MILILNPQIRDNDKIWYEIEHQRITATINDVTDTFDFTDMPDGELQVYDDNYGGVPLIETTLREVPILSANKENGILTVRFIFSIDSNEQDERLLFPEPMSLVEFNDLMYEIKERDKEVEPDGGDDLEGQ